MPTFFDLLKYAKTGLASPDMTAYDKLKAMAMCGGGLSPYTIIGQPPISFLSDGTPLTSVTIKGNGQQTGTPSPQNIVPFDGTGERTGNLFDKSDTNLIFTGTSLATANEWYGAGGIGKVIRIPCNPSTTYTISGESDSNIFRISMVENEDTPVFEGSVVCIDVLKETSVSTQTFTTTANTKYILVQVGVSTFDDYINVLMLNSGSTALPYEPYGYKIPITNASVTTPLYLGEVSTVRRIKKLVLTGDESNWGTYSVQDGSYCAFLPLQNFMGAASSAAYAMLICTHYVTTTQNNIYNGTRKTGCSARTNQGLLIRDENITSETDFKAFLQQQYAADNPVTIWYALATTETGIVNEPLYRIGDYCDELTTTTPIPTAKGSNTLTVDTTVQPSEVSITGNIKPTT